MTQDNKEHTGKSDSTPHWQARRHAHPPEGFCLDFTLNESMLDWGSTLVHLYTGGNFEEAVLNKIYFRFWSDVKETRDIESF